MKKYIPLLIFLLLLSVAGCKNTKPENSDDNAKRQTIVNSDRSINQISVLFYNYLIDWQPPIKPEDIKLSIPDFAKDPKGVLDADITDSVRIANLKKQIDLLTPSQNSSPLNARVVALIRYTDGSQDQLCLGGTYVNEIFVNGIMQETNNELLFLLKNYIGFYPWIIGDDMFKMQELQDNSFAKMPYLSTPYYERYQAALAKK